MMKAGWEYCAENKGNLSTCCFSQEGLKNKKKQEMEPADRRDPAKVTQGARAMLKLSANTSCRGVRVSAARWQEAPFCFDDVHTGLC